MPTVQGLDLSGKHTPETAQTSIFGCRDLPLRPVGAAPGVYPEAARHTAGATAKGGPACS